MLKNTEIGNIQHFLSEGRDMAWIAEHLGIDLTLALALLLDGKPDEERLDPDELNISLRPYDVWNFPECHDLFGINWPGRIPGHLIAHVLYFFTDQGSVILDPMAGGGTVIDGCLLMNRKCFAYDRKTEHRKDIIAHDLQMGWPEKTKKEIKP